MVVEAEDVPWLPPEEIGVGRPGLEGRCHELLSQRRRAAVPEIGADRGARLATAGLGVTATRAFETGPRGLARREDLTLHATRTAWRC